MVAILLLSAAYSTLIVAFQYRALLLSTPELEDESPEFEG